MGYGRPVSMVVYAVVMALVLQLLEPGIACALTSGPTQPEFATFEPVGTDVMVDPFTGHFSYSVPVLTVPGPDGAGYPLSLGYNSGTSGEEDASWVGKGWTLNAGSIVRNREVFPDDYDGAQVKQINRGFENWTVMVSKAGGAELFSNDLPTNVSAQVSSQYNNNTGYHHITNAHISADGYADIDYSVKDGETTIKPTVSMGKLLAMGANAVLSDVEDAIASAGISARLASLSFAQKPDFLLFSGESRYNVNFPNYTGGGFFGSVEVTGNVFGLSGVNGTVAGSYVHTESQDRQINAYGSMYSHDAAGNASADMDYSVEKEAQYTTRDNYIGIPVGASDYFNVFGEGVTGVFQLHQSGVGQFRPSAMGVNYRTSELQTEVHLAGAVGIGVGTRVIEHTSEIGGWESLESHDNEERYFFADPVKDDEPFFFRYIGDPGGSVEFDPSDRPVYSGLPPNIPLLNLFENYRYSMSSFGINPHLIGGRAGRSTYVGYHTNAEMTERPLANCYNSPGPAYFKAYNKADSSRRFVDRINDAGIQKGVGEFMVARPDGMRYVYGLPVYSRNECELSFGLDGAASTDGHIVNKQCKIDDPSTNGTRIMGQTRPVPYASSYLLTEITTPNYIDRTNDGPSADDYGGWTKFNYQRTAGSAIKSGGEDAAHWYKWRAPYRGLAYNRNSLSDPNDDMGSVSYGEKEIYYLSSIETKTHIAFFRTSERLDAFPAAADELIASGGQSTTLPNSNMMRRLDSISLYAKNPDGTVGKLIQTVHFEYDYSLWPGTPNSKVTQPDNPDGGQLTLKRLYFTNEGAMDARTNFYSFGYQYRKSGTYDAAVNTKYPTVTNHADGFASGDETPSYDVNNVDRWGFYRHDGAARAAIDNPWVDQTGTDAHFDPAAWQLKWIHLPSGGEIQVQYEQNEYAVVQNRPAMAMASLLPAIGSNLVVSGDQHDVYLNLDDLGLHYNDPNDPTHDNFNARVNALVTEMQKQFLPDNGGEGEAIYFKFLYALQGTTPLLSNCASEYIAGYSHVDAIARDGNNIKVTLGAVGNTQLDHPQDLAKRFYATRRAGIIDKWGNCDPRFGQLRKRDDDSKGDIFFTLFSMFNDRYYDPDETAQWLNLAYSYLRVPTPFAKKGGGFRVKRVLTYDPGIEPGAAALYGTEYTYTMPDGKSSGVATNEPQLGRNENALIVQLHKRREQMPKIFVGADLEEFDGPLGESLLPAASVGYRRVVAHNIHGNGELTGTGYTVSEFYTAYDYPFNAGYAVRSGETYPLSTATKIGEGDQFLEYSVVGGFGATVDRAYRTQGFSFVLNSMHGRPKRMATYGGTPGTAANGAPVTETTYEYFAPGEPVPLRRSVTDESGATGYPGREQEVVMENRLVDDETIQAGAHADFALGVATLLPIPLVGISAGVSMEDHMIAMQAVTKVVRYPAIVKAVTTLKDGVKSRVENVGFDPESGAPVVMRSVDGYDGLTLGTSTTAHSGAYYAYAVPAFWEYPALGQIARSERMRIGDNSVANNGLAIEKWYNPLVGGGVAHYLNFKFTDATQVAATIGALTAGDLVVLYGSSGGDYLGTFHVGRISGNQVELVPTYISNNNTIAMTTVRSIEVVRSGRTNQLGAQVGSVTTYGDRINVTPVPMQ
ncbi:MAG: hypothetical protein JST22_07905 [Bacteroidetes bacterium]|nr:hypothetical protein [Bacteroidota bacterium]